MTVHIDRAHHHPKVYKLGGCWHASCARCGVLVLGTSGAAMWRLAITVALKHSEALS